MNRIYLIAFTLLIVYLLILFALNRIPNVKITSIGWFKLCNVLLELPTGSLQISSIKIVPSLLARKIREGKWLSIDIKKVHVKLHSSLSSQVASKKPKSKGNKNIDDIFSVKLPKFVFEYNLVKILVNLLKIQITDLSVTSEDFGKEILYLHMIRSESIYDGLSKIQLSIYFLDCRIENIGDLGEEKKLLRNAEFKVKFDLIELCLIDKKHVLLNIYNIETSFRLGKLNIPYETLIRHKQKKQDKSSVQTSAKAKGSSVDLEPIVNYFKKFDINVEELCITYGDFSFSLLNLSLILQQAETFKAKPSDLQLSIYLTLIRLHHKGSNCLNILSSNITTKFNMNHILQMAKLDGTNVLPFFDWDLVFEISNPSITIYYDQLDYLLNLGKREKEKTKVVNNSPKDVSPKKHIIEKLRKIVSKIVIIHTQINLVMPHGFSDGSAFHRESESNEFVTLVIKGILHDISAKNFKKEYLRTQCGSVAFNTAFRLKGVKLDASGNTGQLSKVNLLCRYKLNENKLSLKVVSKRIEFSSINAQIFYMIRALLDRKKSPRRIENYPIESEQSDDINEKLSLLIFEIIPPFINSIAFKISSIDADIICNENIPSYIVYSEKLGKDIDLSQYKRGVSLRINEVAFLYKLSKEEVSGHIKSIQCFTMSECSGDFLEADTFTDFQSNSSESDLSDISSVNSIEVEDIKAHDSRKIKTVLSLFDIELKNSKKNIDELLLRIPQIDGHLDTFLVWCVIYAETLINSIAPKKQSHPSPHQKPAKKGKKPLFNIELNSLTMVINLPNKTDVLLEVENLHVSNCFMSQIIKIDYARLLGIHPSTKLWTRLLTICNPLIKFSTIKDTKQLSLEIVSDAIKFMVPYQFLYYTVIDNFITFFKAIKQIQFNFKNLSSNISDFQRIMPAEKSAVKFPLVHLQSKRLGVLLEDDPFEIELGYIFNLGLVEQRERIRKYKLFDMKVEDIDLKTDKSIESKIELSNTPIERNIPRDKTNIRNENGNDSLLSRIFENIKDVKHEIINDDNRRYTEEEAKEEIDRARERLYKEISKSWIMKFQKFKDVKTKHWKTRTKEFWGVDLISPIVRENYKITDYHIGPKLMGILMSNIDLTLDSARIPDIDQFLHDYGKGQPKLTYSILVPLYIQLKSRLFYIFLKDYPLPVLSFPENSNQTESFILSGNVVINEKLVTRKEEMRFIYVPFSYADSPRGISETDSFYSVYIPRTLTPVKAMMNLECNINTEKTSMFTWCKSYQSGLLASGTALDNFTKPQIDDSPIGWWDKLALTVHGRIVFNIKNEFSLHMKASTSPYSLAGKSAGLTFLWKNNVRIRINDSKKTEEFIQVDSDSFILGVPNYSLGSQRAWNFTDYKLEQSRGHEFDDEVKKLQKSIITLTSDEKVRWIGGVEFERNKNNSKVFNDDQERTSEFKPHYDVIVTNPKFDWHPDSYENFRSDYVHFSLSVISKSSTKNCSNVLYLTPLTFHYFYHWWYIMTDYSSMPVRRGNLFNQTLKSSNHVKLGSHLFTMKYQLIFEPLTFSHTYLNYLSDTDGRNMKIKFTGLKGKVSKCSIDLHQRKEWIRFVNKNLGIDNKILHLKMSKGEVNIEDADIRFLNTIFEDISVRGYLVNFFKGDPISPNRAPLKQISYDDWVNDMKGNGASSWFDSKDFTELEFLEELSPYPKVEILPFAKIPEFSYYRDFSVQKDGAYPFGNEPCHDCLIDAIKPEDVQIKLINRRIETLKNEIDEIEGSNNDPKTHSSNSKYDDLKEKLSIMKIIRDGFQRDCDSSDSSYVESSYDGASTHNLSKYSSRKSYNDLKEFTNSCSSAEKCRNRFIIHNLNIVWNDVLRNLFLDYSQKVSDRKTEVYFMSKKALDYIEAMANKDVEAESTSNDINTKEYKSGEQVINSFHEEINNTSSDNLEIENNYLIKLIHPQVQLLSSKVDSSILITSRELEVKISSVAPKDEDGITSDDLDLDVTETRYGVLFQDSHVFVLEDVQNDILLKDDTRGGELFQWVDLEVIYDSSWMKDQLLLEKNSMALIYKKPNYLSSDKNKAQHNDITVQLAKIVLNATSDQYSAIYYIVTDLLLHTKGPRDEFTHRLDNLILLSNLDDFKNITDIIKTLQLSIRDLHGVLIRLSEDYKRKNRDVTLALNIELERRKLELLIVMKGYGLIRSACKSNKRAARNWNILVDQVIWHLLDNQRNPFIDFALKDARFTKIESYDGSNLNHLTISMVQGFNLQSNSIYPELISLLETEKHNNKIPMIQIGWKMLPAIGGIVIMQHANLDIQPMKIELDYTTAKELFGYLFPKDDFEELESEEDSQDISDSALSDDNISVNTNTSHAAKKSRVPSPVKSILRRYKKFSKDNDNELDSSSMKSSMMKDYALTPDSNSSYSSMQSSDDHSSNSNGNHSGGLKIRASAKKPAVDDDVTLILNRSSKYVSIVDVNISELRITVSFRGPKHLKLLNVNKLMLRIPTLKYSNKIWSGKDFVNKLKKDVIKAILGNTGKILSNKFKLSKKSEIHEPLSQISDYDSYVSLTDLQDGGHRHDEQLKHNYAKQYRLLQQEKHKKHHAHSNLNPARNSLRPEDIYEYVKDSETEE